MASPWRDVYRDDDAAHSSVDPSPVSGVFVTNVTTDASRSCFDGRFTAIFRCRDDCAYEPSFYIVTCVPWAPNPCNRVQVESSLGFSVREPSRRYWSRLMAKFLRENKAFLPPELMLRFERTLQHTR